MILKCRLERSRKEVGDYFFAKSKKHFKSAVEMLLSHAHYHCDMVLAFELTRALQIVREVYWMAGANNFVTTF